MAGSRARRLRRQKRQQEQQAQKAQLEESTTYSDLLATTIPANNSSQSAAKVAQTLGIIQNGGQNRCSFLKSHSPIFENSLVFCV